MEGIYIFVLKNISKRFGGTGGQTVLSNISVSFPVRGLVAILGKSGSGKSTLLNLLSLQDEPTDGTLLYREKNTKSLSGKEKEDIRAFHFGFVYQKYNLIEDLDAVQNIEMPLLLSGKSGKAASKKANALLKRFGMEDKRKQKASLLSGGEAQRVALMRALANDPDVIFADEPTGALDEKNGEAVLQMMKEIGKEKLVIMVTHNESLAARYADQIMRLVDGKLVTNEHLLSEHIPVFRRKRRSTRRGWQPILFRSHWKKDRKKIILSFLATFVGFLTTIVSIGFYEGSEDVAMKEPEKSLLRYFGRLSVSETVEIEDSPLSLTRISRPNPRTLEGKLPATLTAHPDYGYFLPEQSAFWLDETEQEAVAFAPLYDASLEEWGKSLLIEGTAITDLRHECLINREFADQHQDCLGQSIRLSNEVILPKEDGYETVQINLDWTIVGVVKEFAFLNEPRVYYSYFGLVDDLSAMTTESGDSLINLVEAADPFDPIGNYDYLIFAHNEDGIGDFLRLSEWEGYSFSSPTLTTAEAFRSLQKAVLLSIVPFLVIELLIAIFIIGAIAFSSFIERRKETAILNALGGRRGQIAQAYASESATVSLLGMAAALLISPLASWGLNLYLSHRIAIDHLIQIPFRAFLGISYFFIPFLLIIAFLVGYLGSRIPLQSIYRTRLAEALRDE